MSSQYKFLDLANKVQHDALKDGNVDLFVDISKLKSLMLEYSHEEYLKGSEITRLIYTNN